MIKLSNETRNALAGMGSGRFTEAYQATELLAEAVDAAIFERHVSAQVLKEAVFDGAILSNVFYPDDSFTLGARVEYPVDPMATNDIQKFKAYEITEGGWNERTIFGSQVEIATKKYGNSIKWPIDLVKAARFNWIEDNLDAYMNGLQLKNNDDSMLCLMAAAYGRGLFSSDSAASADVLTPQLIFNMQADIVKYGGGNQTSTGRRQVLTDMLVPTSGLSQMRSWTVSQVPESVRTDIWNSGQGRLSVPGLQFHPVDELEKSGGRYYSTWTGLGSTDFAASDTNLVLGLNLTRRMVSFVNPIIEPFTSYPEGEIFFKEGYGGVYGRGRWGWAVLDPRYVLAGSY